MVSGAFCAICIRLTLRAEATKSREDGLRSVANLLQSIKATDLVSRDSQLSNFFFPHCHVMTKQHVLALSSKVFPYPVA